MKKALRVLKPAGKHKSYRFQELVSGKWVTLKSSEISALAEMNPDQAAQEAEKILAGLYADRDKALPMILPFNQKVLDDFLADKYPRAKQARLARKSLEAETTILKTALVALGNIALSSTLDEIQDKIDSQLSDNPLKHSKVTTAVNRLRVYLDLPKIYHKLQETQAPEFLTEEQIDSLLAKLSGEAKVMVGAAFASGLRKGELWGLKKEDYKNGIIFVQRQISVDGYESLPKNRKKRKAMVLPKYEKYLLEWMDIKDSLNKSFKIGEEIRKFENIRFHSIRHSFAILLISKGCSLATVAQSMGHSEEVCSRYYVGHTLSDDAITLMRLKLAQ